MPRIRSRGRGVRGPRRGVEWLGAFADGGDGLMITVGPNTSTSFYVVLPSQARAYTDPTLVRTRGRMAFSGETISGVVSNVTGAAGLIAWTDRDDADPGAANAPRPFTDTNLDWIWHTFLVAGASGTLGSPGSADMVEIDSKAMRKLGADQGLLFVVENGSLDDLVWFGGMRCLIKE